ncbi:MAG TPA: hypothetical protein VJN96_18245 [Vicinamibacterales bacterium]|nr:hypothetical protein [Vicinamibacterales bacterium]
MRGFRLDHVARFGGIAFVVLAFGGFMGAGDAGFDDGVKIAAYVAEHRDRILIGTHLAAIGLLFFVLWSWWIMNAIDRINDQLDNLGLAILVAAAVTAAVEFGVIALYMTLALISNHPVDPQIARALANAYSVFSYVDYFPLAVFFLAFGIAALRTRIVGAWVGWTAIVFVPATLIAAAPGLGLDWPVGLPAFAWVCAANIALVRSKRLAGNNSGVPSTSRPPG